MKFAKKLLSVLLVVLMLVTMALPAMADTPITITINDTHENHKYVAYQVFTGDLDNTTGILSNVQWGASINGAALLNALKSADAKLFSKDPGNTINPFANAEDAEDVAKAMNGWGYNETPIKNFADIVYNSLGANAGDFFSGTDNGGGITWQQGPNYTIQVDAPGYYLIKEVSDPSNNKTGYTDYLMLLTNNTSIAPKVNYPTFALTISNRTNGDFGEAIDAQIDDRLYLKFSGTLPTSLNDYHQYFIRYKVELPDWLSIPTETNEIVNIIQGNGQSVAAPTNRYDVVYDTSSRTITLTTKNLRDGSSSMNLNATLEFIVAVEFNQHDHLIYGLGDENPKMGNVLQAKMFYSGDMNEALTAVKDTFDEVTQAEMLDEISVYTYQAQFKKVDGVTKQALAGADLRLYRNVTSEVENTEETVKTYAVLENTGDNKVYKITKWVAWDKVKESGDLTQAEIDNGWVKAEDVTLTSTNDGLFTIQGLDHAAYHVEETKAPVKYTKLEESVPYSIASVFTGRTLTSLSGSIDGTALTGNVNDGTLAVAEINNTPGSTLPATGGMGTTIFYIAGAVLLLGSITAFAVKKRGEN